MGALDSIQNSPMHLDSICPYCQNSFEDLNLHGSKDTMKSQCSACAFAISNEQCVTEHEKLVHELSTTNEECQDCNIQFTSERYLVLHQKDSHSVDVTDDSSGVTNDTLEDQENQNSIDEEANENSEFQCVICKEQFDNVTEKNQHMKDVHLISLQVVQPNESRLKCFKCEKVFNTESLKLEHLQNDHSNDDFEIARIHSSVISKTIYEGVQEGLNSIYSLSYYW